jgi:uncharacterized protein (DUF2147 family)
VTAGSGGAVMSIMRSVMNVVLAATAAVLLMAPASSAVPMSADDSDGPVTIFVKGRGLHVDRISVTSDKVRRGERFRVYRHTGSAATSSNVTRWRKAKTYSAGMTHFSGASWKINRNFPHGTWLCAVATKSAGNPCIKVHR